MYTILLIEDDLELSAALKEYLEKWGYKTIVPDAFDNLDRLFEQIRPDLIVMDFFLPQRNGLFWTEQIRACSSVPILFLSSAAEETFVISALSKGADDYMIKPVKAPLLAAKIQAMLRRRYTYKDDPEYIEHNGIRFYQTSYIVRFNNLEAELTKNEAKILQLLLENPGRIVSREKLMQELWNTDCYIDVNTLSVNVNRLRKKLETIGLDSLITTRKGAGYLIL